MDRKNKQENAQLCCFRRILQSVSRKCHSWGKKHRISRSILSTQSKAHWFISLVIKQKQARQKFLVCFSTSSFANVLQQTVSFLSWMLTTIGSQRRSFKVPSFPLSSSSQSLLPWTETSFARGFQVTMIQEEKQITEGRKNTATRRKKFMSTEAATKHLALQSIANKTVWHYNALL